MAWCEEAWSFVQTLAQISDLEVLKAQYRHVSDETLKKWRGVVTGAHRAAMEAVLAERADNACQA